MAAAALAPGPLLDVTEQEQLVAHLPLFLQQVVDHVGVRVVACCPAC